MKNIKMALMITAAGIILGLSGCVVQTASPPYVETENYYAPMPTVYHQPSGAMVQSSIPEPAYGTGPMILPHTPPAIIQEPPYGSSGWTSYDPYYDPYYPNHQSSILIVEHRPEYRPAPVIVSPPPVVVLKPQPVPVVTKKLQPAPVVTQKPQPVPPVTKKPQSPPTVTKKPQSAPPLAQKPQSVPTVAQKPQPMPVITPKPQPPPIVTQKPQSAPPVTQKPQSVPTVAQKPQPMPVVALKSQPAPAATQRMQPAPSVAQRQQSTTVVTQKPLPNENRKSLSSLGVQNNNGRDTTQLTKQDSSNRRR